MITTNNNHEKKRRPAYFHNPSNEPLRAITTGQLLDLAAEKWPHKHAIISAHENKTLTFLQAKQQADLLGSCLLRLGLRPGDRLALIGVNTIHWYTTMMATAKTGIILVMVNPAFKANELKYVLTQVKAKGIISDLRFKTQDYPKLLTDIVPGISSAPPGYPLNCPELPELQFVILASEEKLPGCYRLKDVMSLTNCTAELHKVEEQIQPEDPAYIQFSSGTTGVPKGAILSHFGTINNCHYLGKRLGYDKMPSSVLCLQVPLFHIFGSVLGIMSGLDFGITLYLPGPIFKKENTVEILQKSNCNILYGTSTMYIDICNEIRALLPGNQQLAEACTKIDLVVCGGSMSPSQLAKDISKTFPSCKIQFIYGMTEASPICFANKLEDSFEQRTTTVGYLADNLEVKIVDRDGKTVAFGTPGEAWFRSYANFIGYWDNEKKTKEAKTIDGWLRSGDLMILREDGYGIVVGRIKDVIIRGGENIFPAEIEDFLMQHPDIIDAQVFGVSNDRLGEEVAVAIKLRDSSTMTESSLQEHCKGKISHFKIPKHVRFVKDYPITLSGKVMKYVLREMLEEELNKL